jgi:hypothetical protein
MSVQTKEIDEYHTSSGCGCFATQPKVQIGRKTISKKLSKQLDEEEEYLMDRMKLEEIIERNLGSPTINIPNINGASSQSPDERLPIREFIEVISDVDSPQLRI